MIKVGYEEVRFETYRKNKKFFESKGFTYALAERLVPISSMPVWDLYYLFEHAKQLLDGSCYLEIGAYLGSSLNCVAFAASASNKTIHLRVIDACIWSDFLKNCQHLDFMLYPCGSDLAKDYIQDESINLLFVDGSHVYEQVKKDFINYYPKLRKGGILLGHDYPQEGVKKAALEVFGVVEVPENSCMFKVTKR